ncbi:MAG: hypothetical protein ACRD2A_13500, partial [Vicinamibacterales bacterium]
MATTRRILGPAVLVAAAIILVGASAGAERAKGRWRRATLAVEQVSRAAQISTKQRRDMEARLELASMIINRLQSEAASRGLAANWRQPAFETLLPLSLAALERVSERVVNLDALAPAVSEAANDPNLLGDTDEDLVYTPIDPCRFIDTRFYAGGPINGIRGFDLDVTGASYGGSGTCNPTAALGASGDAIGAISANLTIVGPAAAPGFLAVKPTANSPVSSLVNWYQAGPTVQLANAGIFQTVNGLDNFLIQTSTTTHVLMDILGAFIRPEATALQQTIVQDSVPGPSGAEGFNASPNCPAGFTLTGGGCFTDVFLHDTEATYPGSSTSWQCSSNNASAIASN